MVSDRISKRLMIFQHVIKVVNFIFSYFDFEKFENSGKFPQFDNLSNLKIRIYVEFHFFESFRLIDFRNFAENGKAVL